MGENPGDREFCLQRGNVAEKTSVYILAANRLLREALDHTFRVRADMEIVGSSEHPPQGVQALASLRPNVLLINGVPENSEWVGAIPEALGASPKTRVIVFGMQEDTKAFFRCVRSGAVGYLLSEASAADLVLAVRAVMRGEAVCPPRLCRAMFQYMSRQVSILSPRLRIEHGLTRREQQILPLIAQGLTNKEIAAQLHLSEQTVKNHVHRILRKVGTQDRLSAVQALEATPWDV